jgi:hypothetical protein
MFKVSLLLKLASEEVLPQLGKVLIAVLRFILPFCTPYHDILAGGFEKC